MARLDIPSCRLPASSWPLPSPTNCRLTEFRPDVLPARIVEKLQHRQAGGVKPTRQNPHLQSSLFGSTDQPAGDFTIRQAESIRLLLLSAVMTATFSRNYFSLNPASCGKNNDCGHF